MTAAGLAVRQPRKKAKGKIRKGAMMATLAVWHPDIVEFITARSRLQDVFPVQYVGKLYRRVYGEFFELTN